MTQATAMALTLAIEVPVVLGLAAGLRWCPGRLPALALAAVGANLLTHPLLWLSDSLLAGSFEYVARTAGLEILVTLAEAFVFAVPAGLGFRRGLLASFLANAISTAVGLWIYGAL